MARQLFIRLEAAKPSGQPVTQDELPSAPAYRASWLVMENGRPLGNLMRGDLSSAAPLAANAQVVATIPAEHVLLLDVILPGRNRQRLLKAVPYAVEDQLIDDVDDLHFALSPQSVDSRYTVAVIDREKLLDWQKILDDAGLHPQVLLPDALAVKHREQNWTVVDTGERQFVRTERFHGFVAERDSLQTLLAVILREAEQKPRFIEIQSPAGISSDWPEAIADIPLVKKEYDQEATVLLACEYDAQASINLLQGDFSRRENISRHFRPWYGAAALLAVWLAWQGGLNVFQYYQLAARNKALQIQVEQIYRRTFPGAKRVVNASLQMKQKLKELRKQSGKSQTTMSEMLATAAPILVGAEGLKINNLRYQDGKLDLELELKDLQALDKVKEKLAQKQDWQVEIQSASTRKDKVETRMQIRSIGS